jgi:hypothetical protein
VGDDATETLVLQQPGAADSAADAVSAASWTRAAVFATAVAGGALVDLERVGDGQKIAGRAVQG